jgi:hypothetical protein
MNRFSFDRALKRGRATTVAMFERLEDRSLLSAVSPTAVEQYMIELINRARANPAAEAARYGLQDKGGVNEGPPSVTLNNDPKQPLAVNPFITDAARLHAQWMADNNLISQLPHFENNEGTASGGMPRLGYTGPSERARTAGYTGDLPGFENQAYVGGGGASPTASSVDKMHELLFKDFSATVNIAGRGHRVNMLRADLVEIGVGNVNKAGKAVSVQDFAKTTERFLTGVVYRDSNNNNFYTVGEGIGSVTITATRVSDSAVFETTSHPSGGYSLELENGIYNIVATGGSLATPLTFENVELSGLNVKRDFIPTGSGGGGGGGEVVPPDLTATLALAKPITAVVPGETLALAATVTNSGGPATGPFTVTLYRSSDGTLDTNSDTLLSTATVTGTLGAGKSKKVSFSLPISDATPTDDATFFVVADAGAAVTESNENNNTGSLASPDILHEAGNVGGRASVKLLLDDRLGDGGIPTLIVLKGPGNAQVQQTATGLDITLTGTTAASSLTITSPTGQSLIHDLTSDGPLKSITASASKLTGDITTGPVKTVRFDDVADDHTITINAAAEGVLAPLAVSFTFDEVDELSIASAIPIAKYTATAHRDTGNADAITAPSIGSVTIKGDPKRSILGVLEADLISTDSTAKLGIGKVTVANFLRNAAISAAGNVGSVTVGGLENARIVAGKTNQTPTLPDSLDDLADFSLKSVSVKGVASSAFSVLNSVIAAKTLGSVSLTAVQTNNESTSFGIVADKLASFKAAPPSAALPPLKKLDAAISDATPDGDDFIIRVL